MNYLEKIPVHPSLAYQVDDAGLVTLSIENNGVFNYLAQRLFRKPRVSYVHFDAHGSFIWRCIDGNKSLLAIGEHVKDQFGEDEEILYARLATFFRILDSYGFVAWQ